MDKQVRHSYQLTCPRMSQGNNRATDWILSAGQRSGRQTNAKSLRWGTGGHATFYLLFALNNCSNFVRWASGTILGLSVRYTVKSTEG